jgi:release factor glutamine methyltransferase
MTNNHSVAEAFLIYQNLLNKSIFSDPATTVKMLFEDLLDITNTGRSDKLSTVHQVIIEKAIGRLNRGEPFQYVTQVAHFYGLKLYVDRRVLIPRSETEELVYYLLDTVAIDHSKRLSVLDIGTGSGCIALALKYKKAGLDITALDVSADALTVAEINRARYALDVSFVLDNIIQPQNDHIKSASWDYIVSNPPYIQTEERQYMDRQVLDYEPSLALFPENGDALSMYRVILNYCSTHLKQNGWFFLELNEFLSQQIQELALRLGFEEVSIIMDMQGKDRILKGRK